MASSEPPPSYPWEKRRAGAVNLNSRPPVQPLDKDELASLGSLPLRARLLADAVGVGSHSSKRKGSSIEFADYRDYQPGDDLRRIDWRLYGRTDRLHVRETHQETPQRAVFLLDVSNSMAYASRQGLLTKLDFARTLLGAAALLVRRQGDACGIGLLAEELIEWIPPSSSPARMNALWSVLEKPTAVVRTSLAQSLTQALDAAPSRSLFLVASDFYEEIDKLAPVMRRIHFERHDLLAVHIADPAEVDFDFTDPGVFMDVESGSTLAIDPAAIAQVYRERFSANRSAIRNLCAANGFDLLALRTDEPPIEALRSFLWRRSRNRRS